MGQYELTLALCVLLIFLLPSLILVQNIPFISIKVVVWFVFVTQAVTLPLFYLRAEQYRFQFHRPYEFTGLEVLQVYVPLGILLLTIVLISITFSKFLIRKHSLVYSRPHDRKTKVGSATPLSLDSTRSRQAYILTVIGIAAVILTMIPINVLMFKMGIGLTGITPPQLPFRLSGVLTYLGNYIAPSLLTIIYILSPRRSYFAVCLLGLYSIFLGLTTVSRAAAVLVMAAPLAFSIVDKRIVLLVLSFISISLSTLVATSARNFVYIVEAGVVGADLSLGTLSALANAINYIDLERFLLILPRIISRLSSFQDLFMSSQFDANVIGGGWIIFLNHIDWRMVEISSNAMHLEMLGQTVPKGFYMGLYGFWGMAMASINSSYLFVLPYGVYAAIFLILQEHLIEKVGRVYCVKITLLKFATGILTLNFLVSAGSQIVTTLILAVFFIALFPRIKEVADLLRLVGISTR